MSWPAHRRMKCPCVTSHSLAPGYDFLPTPRRLLTTRDAFPCTFDPPHFRHHGLYWDYRVIQHQQQPQHQHNLQHHYRRSQGSGPAVAVIAGAPEKTSTFTRKPTRGRGRMDFSNERVSNMGCERRWTFSLSVILPW